MQAVGSPVSDKRIKCIKSAHLLLNTLWIFVLFLHFYLIAQSPPFTASYWLVEVLLLVTLLLHLLNLLLIRILGFSRLYSSFSCLTIESFSLLLLLVTAFLILKFQVSGDLSSILIEFLLGFFQSLVFFKCVYLRLKYLRSQTHISLYESVLIRFKVQTIPQQSNNICSICLEEMNTAHSINTNLIALPCGTKVQHCFHFSCFENWFKRSTECPLCRGKHYLKTLIQIHRFNSTRIIPLRPRNTPIVPGTLPSSVQI